MTRYSSPFLLRFQIQIQIKPLNHVFFCVNQLMNEVKKNPKYLKALQWILELIFNIQYIEKLPQRHWT